LPKDERNPSRLRLSDWRRWAVGGIQVGRPTPITTIHCEGVVPSRLSSCCMLQRTPPR
jgi:hypothetical protein